MRELRLLLRFIEKDYLFKLIFVLLLYSLVPFAEILFFIYLTTLIRNWLVLVVAVLIGLPGVLVAQSQLQEILQHLKARLRSRAYPGAEIADLLGILVAGVLLVTPGFLTDVVGYLLLVPLLRARLARVLARKLEKTFSELADFLRLQRL
ncbi:MAG TPA: FxsA family protein [Spirochaetia bacterium]|nr:FxsA family protein [Spirochaetia bacterium]